MIYTKGFNKLMNMDKYLKPTSFIDSDSKLIVQKVRELTQGIQNNKEKAKKLFYFVRDQIKYNAFYDRSPENFHASRILVNSEGYCVQKAILLVALARAANIPARLRFAEIRNHLITADLLKIRKTDVFAYNGYADLFINGKWIKVAPTFNNNICYEYKLYTVEFDGEHDAMLPPVSKDGKPHIEYIKDRGPYNDVPLQEIEATSILTKKLHNLVRRNS